MDETARLAANQQTLTQRVDDLSYRVAAAEIELKHTEGRIADLKVLIIEKNNDLRQSLKALEDSIGKAVWWVVTLVGGAIILALLNIVFLN